MGMQKIIKLGNISSSEPKSTDMQWRFNFHKDLYSKYTLQIQRYVFWQLFLAVRSVKCLFEDAL